MTEGTVHRITVVGRAKTENREVKERERERESEKRYKDPKIGVRKQSVQIQTGSLLLS